MSPRPRSAFGAAGLEETQSIQHNVAFVGKSFLPVEAQPAHAFFIQTPGRAIWNPEDKILPSLAF